MRNTTRAVYSCRIAEKRVSLHLWAANLQNIDWNGLRYLLAVHRAGTISAAARVLGVNDTTVARRLRALSLATGTELTIRGPDRTHRLTDAANALVQRAAHMDNLVAGMSHDLAQLKHAAVGTVRLTAVPFIMQRFLIPALPRFFARNPHVQLELVPDNRDANLTRRDADLALRLARPTLGGSAIKTRKIHALAYTTFIRTGLSAASAPWITYDDSAAHLPPARWLERKVKKSPQQRAPVRVTDLETALAACLAGLGQTLLPTLSGSRVEGLNQTGPDCVLQREMWLLFHQSPPDPDSIRVVIDWITADVFSAEA